MKRPGTYVLFLRFDEVIETEVGALGRIRLEAGDYCYVGSAMGGLDQRLSRHLSHEKKKRWHIDYLTSICSEMHAMEHEGPDVTECDLARRMAIIGNVPILKGFGCSDCGCQTHLFKVDRKVTEGSLEDLGMTNFENQKRISNFNTVKMT